MINPSVSKAQLIAPKLSTLETYQLRKGDVLVQTKPHTLCGGALNATMYLPKSRSHVWDSLTDYPRWSAYFPDVTQSRIIEDSKDKKLGRRLYQAAEKSFLFINAQVNIFLRVFELEQQYIRFQFEKGSFSDFTADLRLSDFEEGTLLQYSVAATPLIPVPSFFVEQAMKMDLPVNLRNMRKEICKD